MPPDLTATDFRRASAALKRLAVRHFGKRNYVWLMLTSSPLGYHLASEQVAHLPGHDRVSRKDLSKGRTLWAGWTYLPAREFQRLRPKQTFDARAPLTIAG